MSKPARSAGTIVLFLLCGVLLSAPIEAQDSPSFGFLVRQPQRGQAVPILPANAARFIEAQYDVGGVPVDVFVVPGAEVDRLPGGSEDWSSVQCPELTMQRSAPAPSERYVARSDRDRYNLFLSTSLNADTVCRFGEAFIDTFEFFLDELEGSLSEGPPPEFPAVIDLAR